VTFVANGVIPVNETTAGFAYLLLVLVIASTWGFLEAALSSMLATLTFDYFFVPPIGSVGSAKLEDRVALFSFLVVSLIRQLPICDGQTANFRGDSCRRGAAPDAAGPRTGQPRDHYGRADGLPRS